ncbi:glycosyltransferase [Tautonia plasticadhaerens]|uniref:MurG-like transferase n=1 Tax=Tautonia plasticadhaerens TaxID=2527974 RepID=A0A518H4T8_9BACT|nr:glycosyltransferase [Tautonia plasticadhaerens]QDV35853.1 MurG-like transferase [Tautonia plasticadhaerens]
MTAQTDPRPTADDTSPSPDAGRRPTARRIVLGTFGSLGDVHPYVALARELKRRGHRPSIATSAYWRPKVEQEGIDFSPVRPDAPDPDAMHDLMARLFDPRRGPKVVISEVMMPSLRESFEDTRAAAEGADLLVSHPLTFAVRLVAEAGGIPWASSVLAPMSFLSAFDPPTLPAAPALSGLRRLGPRFHRPLFRGFRLLVAPWERPWRRLRAELGLPPTGESPVFEGQHAPDLVLAMFSKLLGAPQPDWPPNAVVTGFSFFDRDSAEDDSPEELLRFLDDGPPPVVFTLGSSAVWAPGRFFNESLGAVRRLGCRAILLTGPEGANARPSGLPPGVLATGYAPYSGLFPRCAAIVHQGGVGTTAQAMRAGRPMLVVPHGFDQHDNADRVSRLGIARTLSRPRYTASRVADALRPLLDDPGFASRSAEVGHLVRAEDGPAAAADAIEALVSRGRAAR